MGAVVLNHEGNMMVSGVHQGVYLDDTDLGEFETLRFGIRFVSETDLFSLVVESDFLQELKLVLSQNGIRNELFGLWC